ncbi:MAG TPA: hypothetical protein PK095_17080 [Myxococcota bacterium]|nr:hypothetical protein [Myxococcota bacterium]
MRAALPFVSLLVSVVSLVSLSGASALAKDGPPIEFDRELADLWTVAACAKPAPEGRFPANELKAHCADLDRIFSDYEKRWATPARPFFASLVPKDVPKVVVYPFGGADLLTALAVYPELSEITSISLEAGGDPRSFGSTPPNVLAKHLALHRKFMAKLVLYNHSRTLDLALLKGTPLPSQLIFALVGLKVHGYEPVGLKAVMLEADGTVHGYTARDVALADEQARDLKGSARNRKLNDLFAGYELRFKKRGVDNAPIQTYRHFQANLANDELAKDPRILRYLEGAAKRGGGRFAAITKAASYLLWWGNFSTFREFLKEHVAWMVSDSTGLNAIHLDPKVWEQDVYGRFFGTFLKSGVEGIAAIRALYEAQPKRPLPFDYFGYPDNRKNGHLIVTRRR